MKKWIWVVLGVVVVIAALFGGRALLLRLTPGQPGEGVGLFHLASQFFAIGEDAPQRGLRFLADAKNPQGCRVQGGHALPAAVAYSLAAAEEVGQVDEGG